MASIKPAGSRALILGLGGGSVADEFLRLGFDVEGCELDERIAEVASKFFYPHQHYPVYVDDARHLIRTMEKRYDIIMLDVFAGEYQPPHVLTLESFEEIKKILAPDGLILINSTGILSGERGLGARSIVQTLRKAGFDLRVLTTPGAAEVRNVLYVASPSPLDFSGLTLERQNECCRTIGNVPIALPFTPHDRMTDGIVLHDNRPVLEVLNLPVNELWRMHVMSRYSDEFHGSIFY